MSTEQLADPLAKTGILRLTELQPKERSRPTGTANLLKILEQFPEEAIGSALRMMADPAFEEAQQAMERDDLDGAAAAFQKVLANSPGNPAAAMGLAQVNLIRRVSGYDQNQVRRAAAEDPANVEAQSSVADIEVATGRIDEGFDRLLGTIRRTFGDDRDRARVHLVSLFDVFPPGDPRVAKARATLSSLLF